MTLRYASFDRLKGGLMEPIHFLSLTETPRKCKRAQIKFKVWNRAEQKIQNITFLGTIMQIGHNIAPT